MFLIRLLSTFIFIIFLNNCSSSYNELKNIKEKKPSNFQEFIMAEYKKKATFEAEEMHDWDTVKLYSNKALSSLKTDEIYPEDINYWKIPKDKVEEIEIAHESLSSIYEIAKITDPQNLAIAISSLDCWSEQQEENWQLWDINECKNNFLSSVHKLYEKISKKNENNGNEIDITNTKNDNELAKDNIIIQIVYFDFDAITLSRISINKIENFLKNNSNKINQYIITGHTDTKGSEKYNLVLSLERANVVKDLLIKNGINFENIKVLGKGEESLAVITDDNVKHPANRRVVIKVTN